MTRDAYRDRLLDLAYGELSGREAREVEAHAAGCEACRAELARIRGTRRIMAALPDEAAPERGERILLAAAREAAEARGGRRLAPRWLLAGAVVAASVAIVAAVSLRVSEWTPRRGEQRSLLESPYASRPAAGAPAAAAAPA
ncbi:MAG TPA: zf-HC2 domain-containing protein, partial [Anaeromyxobacter sp.]